VGAVSAGVIVALRLATEEEHQDDGDEGGEQRDDEEDRSLKSGWLLSEGVMPEFHGNEGCCTECASRGGHRGGCTSDS